MLVNPFSVSSICPANGIQLNACRPSPAGRTSRMAKAAVMKIAESSALTRLLGGITDAIKTAASKPMSDSRESWRLTIKGFEQKTAAEKTKKPKRTFFCNLAKEPINSAKPVISNAVANRRLTDTWAFASDNACQSGDKPARIDEISMLGTKGDNCEPAHSATASRAGATVRSGW